MSQQRPAAELDGALLLIPLVTVVVLGLGAVIAFSPLATAVLLGLALFSFAVTLPLRVLPAISVWLFGLLPLGYLLNVPNWFGRFWTPAVLVLTVWLVRVAWRQGRADLVHALRWIVPLAALLLGLCWFSVSEARSVNWVALLFVCVVFPAALLFSFDNRTSTTLLRAWIALGITLSLVAVLESLVERNPLSRYYSFDQHWSVYRVSTTLGHPLVNGTFFAVTACVAAFAALRKDGPRGSAFACFLLSGLAAALTGSRSGVYALVCGLGVGLLVMLISGRTSVANKLLGIVISVAAVVILPALPSIAGRSSSAEGIASGLYRDESVRLAGKLFLVHPWIGFGPGASAIAVARSGATLPLENAVLGTVVSVGIVGLVGLLLLAILVLVRTARGGRPDGIAAVATYVVAGSAFPLWEPNPAALILIGLVMIATRAPVEPPSEIVTGAAGPVRLVVPRQATRVPVRTPQPTVKV